jgi:hypothetical protein
MSMPEGYVLKPPSPKLHGATLYMDSIKKQHPEHASLVDAVRPIQEHVIHATMLVTGTADGQFFATVRSKSDPRVAVAIQNFANASGGKITAEQATRILLGRQPEI